jgi:manganese transport protein
MAGQIVMEGFLNFRMRPWLRRLLTRSFAVAPAAFTIWYAGDKATYQLLILSQVILSMQLPFAVIPLIHFTSDREHMGAFANKAWVRILAWVTAAIIIGLNVRLAGMAIADWLAAAGAWKAAVWLAVIPLSTGFGLLLLWVTIEPLMSRWTRKYGRAPVELPPPEGADIAAPMYHRILVPLDHTALDRLAVSHAAAMGKLYGARIYLLHVEEGVTSQVYGQDSSTAEVEMGGHYLERIAQTLRDQGVSVETAITHSSSPTKEILRYAKEINPDLVIMGAHGHGGLKDLIFGTTISPVRHHLDVPMLIVRPGKG